MVETINLSGLDVLIDGVVQTLPLVANTKNAILLASNGKTQLVIPEPAIRVGSPNSVDRDDASYELRLDASGHGVLATRVPMALLRDEAIPLPIMIDPPVGIVCGHGEGPGDANGVDADCEDNSGCTIDTCVIEPGDVYGTCVYTPQNVGGTCYGKGVCSAAGDCIASEPAVFCNDGNA